MASFDFVDVGHGKERTDTKIKGKSSEDTDPMRPKLTDHYAKFWEQRL